MAWTTLLLDVYQTALRCDFTAHATELPALAGVDPAHWNEAFLALAPSVMAGSHTMAGAYEEILVAAGRDADPKLLDALVAHDTALLHSQSAVYDDTVPVLLELRAQGVATALVSNCAEGTRDLLVATGLADLVDELVLSCEVGVAKPDEGIFRIALERLGAAPETTVFVDDQVPYCEGAARLGIRTVRIARDGDHRDPTAPSSLREIVADLGLPVAT